MFGDLDWPVNASRGLSVIAEFLVQAITIYIILFTNLMVASKYAKKSTLINTVCKNYEYRFQFLHVIDDKRGDRFF